VKVTTVIALALLALATVLAVLAALREPNGGALARAALASLAAGVFFAEMRA